ncbi:MAG: reverse transcriptase family protein [bacterium]
MRENALRHVGRNFLLSLDLKDFFPGISAKWIYRLFREEPFSFPDNIAIPLALLTTYRKSLPTGANTSPILSNFVCRELDEQLSMLAETSELVYTRYAYDLTFSSNLPFTPAMIARIRKIISDNGFQVNEKKVRLRSRHSRQVVTGITVNEKPNIPQCYIRNLRAILHD